MYFRLKIDYYFCRINLSKTNYSLYKHAHILELVPTKRILEIYSTYCKYKNFKSVMPIFKEELLHNNVQIIGYFDNSNLVAFSYLYILNNKNVECNQFAWNYNNPKLHLGIKSLRHECAFYKSKGYEYLYLGEDDTYKQDIDGFETLGPIDAN